MGKRTSETLVGFFVLLGLVGLVFLALKVANLGSMGGGDTYTLKATNSAGCHDQTWPRVPTMLANTRL